METPEEVRLESDRLEELEWTDVATTKCEHYLVLAMSDPNSNMRSVECKNCKSHGASFDPETHELKDGKLVKKEEV